MEFLNKNKYKKIIESWIKAEKEQTCGVESSARYLEEHLPRFEYIFNRSIKLCPNKSISVLDVGRSNLSTMLTNYFHDVVTFGLSIQKDIGGHREIENVNLDHIIFDLNESRHVDKWPERKFDLIIFSEVIEHLHEAPELVMLLLSSMLNNYGYLICTTPNFSFIRNRLSCLVGHNPNSKIRLFSENPAHFREYTRSELLEVASACNLKICGHEYINFPLKVKNIKTKVIRFVSELIPSFRASHFIIMQKIENE